MLRRTHADVNRVLPCPCLPPPMLRRQRHEPCRRTGRRPMHSIARSPTRRAFTASAQYHFRRRSNRLDSAGYGPVTIGKSVSITPRPAPTPDQVNPAFDGITAVAGATDRVTLRGLTINGQGGDNASSLAKELSSTSRTAKSRAWRLTASPRAR